MPHGVATDVYRAAGRDEARDAGGLPRDAFVVGIVAVNKGAPSRKSLAEMIEAFAIFRAATTTRSSTCTPSCYGVQSGTHLPSLLEDVGLDESGVIVVDQYRYLLRAVPARGDGGDLRRRSTCC